MIYSHFINFVRLTRDNFPNLLQEPTNLNWARAITKPVRMMYDEFKKLRSEYILKVRFDAQACYLQSVLNLRFDPVNNGIHIVDRVESRTFIFDGGLNPKNRCYQNWVPEEFYTPGQFAVFNRYLYRCASNSNAVSPYDSIVMGNGQWRLHTGRRMVMRLPNSEDISVKYIVYVPTSLSYDHAEFASVLNYYRFAGLKYSIVTI